MDSTCDVFLTHLPKTITEVVVKNLFSSAGKVLKVKIIDDKKNENYKLCFVGFATLDEALEAVRLADNSLAFGEPIRASISKKCIDGMENLQNRNSSSVRGSNIRSPNNVPEVPEHRFTNIGRGRGSQSKLMSSSPSFNINDVKLNDINLKLKELIDVEIIELSSTNYIFVRAIKSTESSKVEISDLLSKINAAQFNLIPVESPKLNCCYLAKWEDECYYRAEVLEILDNQTYKVTFIDEGTSGDIVREVKHIPPGPLQQYPKQFSMLSLGCPDLEDLRNFVIQESQDKHVKIYWLGEYCLNSIPLVNLFLNEDEIIEKYNQANKTQIREKFSIKFEDLPLQKVRTNPNLAFVPSLYKSQDEFVLQVKGPYSVTLKIKKSPYILPTPGDICIYDKRASNVSQFFRCMIKRRQLFSFDIQLIDTGEKISNVNIDNLYMAEDDHKIYPPMAINCEIGKHNLPYDSNTLCKLLSEDGITFTVVQCKNNNRYVVSFDLPSKSNYEYIEMNNNDYIGKSFKVSISHFVSPMDFYIQIDREDNIQAIGDIQEKINVNYKGSHFKNVDEIEINQAVIAPFIVVGTDSEYFRAKVLEKRRYSPQVHVLFIDYGNDEWVNIENLLNVDEDLTKKHCLALPCQLNVDIKKEAYAHAIEQFSQLVGGSNDDLNIFTMQVMCMNGEKFVVDLLSQLKGSITAILEKSGTCTKRIDEKGLTKPICNGNIKLSSCEDKKAMKPNGYVNQIDHNDITTSQNYNKIVEELVRKITDLEERVLELERISMK